MGEKVKAEKVKAEAYGGLFWIGLFILMLGAYIHIASGGNFVMLLIGTLIIFLGAGLMLISYFGEQYYKSRYKLAVELLSKPTYCQS